MTSDFDRTFLDLEEEQRAGTQRSVEMKEAGRLAQQQARSIAEPYLLSIAPSVHQKLLDLKISCADPVMPWERAKALKRVIRTAPRGYWSFGLVHLFLPRDGYFVTDPTLSGPKGFESMMTTMRLARNRKSLSGLDQSGHHRGILSGEVFVDADSQRVLLMESRTDDDPIFHEIAEWIARSIQKQHRNMSK